MPLGEPTLSTLVVALAVAVVVLAVWVAWLQRSDVLLRRRLRRLIGDAEGAGLDELLDRQFRRLDTVAERVEALNRLHHELQTLSQRSIQKVGVVRFNPFADTGGDQSFAIALLDADGNGVVLSSLHGRADTRIFAKQVQAGMEYYSETGTVKHFDPLSDQHHILFGAADLNVSPDWELNFGVGHGLTGTSEQWIVKTIVGYRFKR